MSFLIAAPASGSGKTTITLGLLRALSQDGITLRGAKSGPDYIDPRFHEAACGQPCLNLDAWAMSADRIQSLASGSPLIVEGAMGLFDGAPPDGKGACADLARQLNLPVVLVVDASRMAQSIAPIVKGFAIHDPSITIAGVILNKVGSPRHEAMLRHALRDTGISVIGAIPRNTALVQPSRHLGLVQAQERPDLDRYLSQAADIVREHLDLTLLPKLSPLSGAPTTRITPPAQSIAIARDAAFAFAYPHLLDDWQSAGATIQTFSPLANDPVPAADLIYLPGGYPELHAARLASNTRFLTSLQTAAKTTDIYGECGGYMALGETLTDADGHRHKMAGLLALNTSFAKRKLHLGYRSITASTGPFAGSWTAHEFHYATTTSATGQSLFQAQDAMGDTLADMGLISGRVSGSFAHIIDRA
ncbi:cobyrinic acid a,c-diamide synthase [Loktanella ponticola]|uniref:Cobyrinic acid a,c-diamide synthase n=1 Tax=Yoonia ponticola TaxID=1524255 RepID=A0A7W9BJH1_9RHOB|nr:cobyrinate a,c-diamide synthase [Yoonia ponticola]MBB5721641.1 cobyrinic acid a,c-diamide synthase [Yoonia ponticola]